MKPMAPAERFAVLTDHEGWFGTAAPGFQQAMLSRCEWREVTAGQPTVRIRGMTDRVVSVTRIRGALMNNARTRKAVVSAATSTPIATPKADP